MKFDTVSRSVERLSNQVFTSAKKFLDEAHIEKVEHPLSGTTHFAVSAKTDRQREFQVAADARLKKLARLTKALLRGKKPSPSWIHREALDEIREWISGAKGLRTGDIGQAIGQIERDLGEIMRLVEELPDPKPGSFVLIPDTNAFVYCPLENWNYDEFETCDVILTPPILSELDKLKVDHRKDEVREKAQNAIRQIKEYRNRGDLEDGIPILKGKVNLYSRAVEPKFGKALRWLDPQHSDDRLLASCFEVMRERARSAVILVTADINLQNKAGFARVQFVEPTRSP